MSAPSAPRRRLSRSRRIVVSAVAVLGLAALAGGGTGLVVELGRKPTAAELRTAAVKEQDARWRIRRAGEIFPMTVRNASGQAPAYRVGIALPAPCERALDRQVAAAFVKQGCRTVLRATYVDASGTLVTTVGIAVMPNETKAETASDALQPKSGEEEEYGLRAVRFPGTVAARFGDAQRQDLSYETGHAPYVLLQASGWADGRKRVSSDDDVEAFMTAKTLLDHLLGYLAKAERPCRVLAVRC